MTAFRATLEELSEAAILLHVVDLSSPDAAEQCQAVEEILADLDLTDKPRITALNKIDLMPQTFTRGAQLERDGEGAPSQIFLSAQTGLGLDLAAKYLFQPEKCVICATVQFIPSKEA